MAEILRKQVRPHLEVVVNGSGTGINCAVRVTGLDPVRPQDTMTITGVPVETIRLLLDYEWDAPPPTTK